MTNVFFLSVFLSVIAPCKQDSAIIIIDGQEQFISPPPPEMDGENGRPVFPEFKKKTSTQIAQEYTDSLTEQLGLDEKQAKKVYKIYLEKAKKEESSMPSGFGSGMRRPSGPPSGGRGGMGGGPGGGMGGMRPPGGGGGQFPSMDQAPSENMPRGTMTNGESEKDREKREKKMKKILTENQYELWQEMELKAAQEREKRLLNEQLLRSMSQPTDE